MDIKGAIFHLKMIFRTSWNPSSCLPRGWVFFRFRTPAGQVKINQTDHQPEAVHSDLHDLMIARSYPRPYPYLYPLFQPDPVHMFSFLSVFPQNLARFHSSQHLQDPWRSAIFRLGGPRYPNWLPLQSKSSGRLHHYSCCPNDKNHE